LTKRKPKPTAARREPSRFDFLVITMFQMALPVWERYEGVVPNCELRNLEERGRLATWTRRRHYQALSEDHELRSWIHNSLLKCLRKRVSVNEPPA
jgi:hypothetical protein